MNYLFVCTGNTCRSPMAQCLMEHLTGHPCQSAGLYAVHGMPASTGARHAMAAMGLSLEHHRAQPVTENLLAWADEIWCMTSGHLASLRSAYPAYQAKYHVFSPPIPDPYGGSDTIYRLTAKALEDQLKNITAKP